MERIKVKKAALLDTLRANRDRHKKIVEAAFDTYREEAIRELEQMLADAKAGKKIRRALSMPLPVDQTGDYDRVIRMVEMSTEDDVVLNETDVAQYIMDQWHWKNQFSASNMRYLSGKAEASLLEGE